MMSGLVPAPPSPPPPTAAARDVVVSVVDLVVLAPANM